MTGKEGKKSFDTMGAIILAGGKGMRFHGPKQFVQLQGKPLWEIVRDKAYDVLRNQNIVTVGVDVPGGETRTGSVINGMRALRPETSRVIILEAARPLVRREQIQALLLAPEPSVTFVIPLVNTVIKRNGEYLNRNELYELLTPQAFDYAMLLKALSSGRFQDMTDETRTMYEYWNIPPHFIETTENLIKITYQRDIPIIERLLEEETTGKERP